MDFVKITDRTLPSPNEEIPPIEEQEEIPPSPNDTHKKEEEE